MNWLVGLLLKATLTNQLSNSFPFHGDNLLLHCQNDKVSESQELHSLAIESNLFFLWTLKGKLCLPDLVTIPAKTLSFLCQFKTLKNKYWAIMWKELYKFQWCIQQWERHNAFLKALNISLPLPSWRHYKILPWGQNFHFSFYLFLPKSLTFFTIRHKDFL